MTLLSRACVSLYQYFIETISVCRTVYEILSIKECCYVEFYVWKIPRIRNLSICIGGPPLQQGVVLKWLYSLSRRNTFVGGTYALPSALLVADTCEELSLMSYVFRKIFSCVIFVSQIVCLYLAQFRSYKYSKITIFKISLQNNAAYLELSRIPLGEPPRAVDFMGVGNISIAETVHGISTVDGISTVHGISVCLSANCKLLQYFWNGLRQVLPQE